jgi:hypothetical protein
MGWVAVVLLGVVGIAGTPLYLIKEPTIPAGQGGGFTPGPDYDVGP